MSLGWITHNYRVDHLARNAYQTRVKKSILISLWQTRKTTALLISSFPFSLSLQAPDEVEHQHDPDRTRLVRFDRRGHLHLPILIHRLQAHRE